MEPQPAFNLGVDGCFDLYNQHFGKHDHNYSHWLRLQLGCGTFSLPHLMMRYNEAALAQRRHAAPLRLILTNIWVAEVAAGHCGGANDALWQSMS